MRKRPPTEEELNKLVRDGLIDSQGLLTKDGEVKYLKLSQLQLYKWIKSHPYKERTAKRKQKQRQRRILASIWE